MVGCGDSDREIARMYQYKQYECLNKAWYYLGKNNYDSCDYYGKQELIYADSSDYYFNKYLANRYFYLPH